MTVTLYLVRSNLNLIEAEALRGIFAIQKINRVSGNSRENIWVQKL